MIRNELDQSKVSRLPIILSDWNSFIIDYARERIKLEIDKIILTDAFRSNLKELIFDNLVNKLK